MSQQPGGEPSPGADNSTPPAANAKESRWNFATKLIAGVSALILAVATTIFTGLAQNLVERFETTHRVDVETNRDRIDTRDLLPGGEYVVSRPIEEVPPPPGRLDTCSGRHEWSRTLDVIDVDATVLRLHVTALAGHKVEVKRIERVDVEDRHYPATGTLLACPGRGASPPTSISLNLDNNVSETIDGATGKTMAGNITVPDSGTQAVDVVVAAQEYYWVYRLRLLLLVDGKEKSIVIDDNGRPFRTSGRFNAKPYRWNVQQDRWIDQTVPSEPDPNGPGAAEVIPPTVDPCSLVTHQEAASELGEPVTTEMGGGEIQGVSGLQMKEHACLHKTADFDNIQVNFTEARSAEDARTEFERRKPLIDQRRTGRPLSGYGGEAMLTDNQRIVILRDRFILDISVGRTGGIDSAKPTDGEVVARLATGAAQRF